MKNLADIPLLKIGAVFMEGSTSCEDVEWEWLLEDLNSILSEKNSDLYWRAEVKNFGWDKRSGYRYLKVSNAEDFLYAVLPDTDCRFRIHDCEKGIAIRNFHHESPTGNEWYYVLPCPQNEYEENSN